MWFRGHPLWDALRLLVAAAAGMMMRMIVMLEPVIDELLCSVVLCLLHLDFERPRGPGMEGAAAMSEGLPRRL